MGQRRRREAGDHQGQISPQTRPPQPGRGGTAHAMGCWRDGRMNRCLAWGRRNPPDRQKRNGRIRSSGLCRRLSPDSLVDLWKRALFFLYRRVPLGHPAALRHAATQARSLQSEGLAVVDSARPARRMGIPRGEASPSTATGFAREEGLETGRGESGGRARAGERRRAVGDDRRLFRPARRPAGCTCLGFRRGRSESEPGRRTGKWFDVSGNGALGGCGKAPGG